MYWLSGCCWLAYTQLVQPCVTCWWRRTVKGFLEKGTASTNIHHTRELIRLQCLPTRVNATIAAISTISMVAFTIPHAHQPTSLTPSSLHPTSIPCLMEGACRFSVSSSAAYDEHSMIMMVMVMMKNAKSYTITTIRSASETYTRRLSN